MFQRHATQSAGWRPSAPARWVLAAALLASPLSCRDAGKAAQKTAAEEVAKLPSIVKESVEQVRNGLPEGAKNLVPMLDTDPGANLAALQRAIQRARASVKDLDVSKGTFFSFADPSGLVLRSESDPDLAAGKSILATFPALAKALEPGAGVVEAFGEMDELRGVRTGRDLQWVVAHSVKDEAGAVKGLFVTGWSMRRYAFYLEEAAKRHLTEIAERDAKKAVPVTYVFVVKSGKAYGAPVTPDVNAEAIDGLDVIGKTTAGPYSGTLEITGRVFGVAAERTPELGDDAAVVVLLSEL